MELGTTIVGIFILLICILPFLMVSVSSKRKKKNKLQALLNYAQVNNAQITLHEIWANTAIGLDHVHNKLFYITQINDQKVFQMLDLSEIESCKIVNISNTFKGKSSSYNVIEKLDLVLNYLDHKKGSVELNIYDINHQNLSITNELSIAEKWSKIINENLIAMINK
jgi:hypothetical protein